MIAKVWNVHQSKKIFLDIIYGTQLRKCKQLRAAFVDRIDTLLKANHTDAEIFEKMRAFIHEETTVTVRKQIQHQGHYRGINRCAKLKHFVDEFKREPLDAVLDLGCGDGTITKTVAENLKISKEKVHGCDILEPAQKTDSFTFTLLTDAGRLPYASHSFDMVYALMSLHHISKLDDMLQEVHRVLKKDGLFIIREHDCVSGALSNVLDLVHGFYSMVWCDPQEMQDFESEYFANYFNAPELAEKITNHNFERLHGTNRNEAYPLFHQGKVINPLKHYWAVFMKK